MLAALQFNFETLGCEVCAFRTAAAARAEWVAQQPQIAIVDQRLPDAYGLDLISKLRSLGIETPAVIITTAPSARLREEARLMDVTIVEKPLLTDELFQATSRYLRLH